MSNLAEKVAGQAVPEGGETLFPSSDPALDSLQRVFVVHRTAWDFFVSFLMYSVFRMKNFSDLLIRSIPFVMLVGPPGTGKTTFLHVALDFAARKIGKTARLLVLSCTDVFSSDLGASGRAIERVFLQAMRHSLAGEHVVLFVDDADALFMARDKIANGSNPSDRVDVTVVLLSCLDRLKKFSNIAVIAATNHVSLIDPALRSRALTTLSVPIPTFEQRLELLLRYLGDDCKFANERSSNVSDVVDRLDGRSGREIAGLVEVACILAQRPPAELSCQDLIKAFNLEGESHE